TPTVAQGALGFDIRTVAINPTSAALLDEMGVWPSLERCAFDRVHVCEELGTRFIELRADEIDRTELGWIVEVSPTVATLWRALETTLNVSIVTGAITRVTTASNAVHVEAGDANLVAHLLIAADGANSTVRNLLGVQAGRFATHQCATATIVELTRDH